MTYLEWNCGSLCDVRLKITLREKKKHTHTQTYTLRERKREEPWTIKSNCKFLQTHISHKIPDCWPQWFPKQPHTHHTHSYTYCQTAHSQGWSKESHIVTQNTGMQANMHKAMHSYTKETHTNTKYWAFTCRKMYLFPCASVNLCFISFDILFLSLFLQLCIPFSLTLLSSGASQRGGGIRKEQMLYSVASLLLSFFHSGFCWNRKSLEILL